jgi:hypothetical protein
MHIIDLTPLAPGVYNDHKADHIPAPPDGWAYIPEDFPLPSTFPRLGSIEAEELTYTREVEVQKPVTKQRDTGMVDEDGDPIMEDYTEMETVTEQREYAMMTVTDMTEGTLPDAPTLSPAQQREAAYNTAKIIPWEGGNITVTEAAQLWQYYAAEGNPKAEELTALIAKAKTEIRERYPDN